MLLLLLIRADRGTATRRHLGGKARRGAATLPLVGGVVCGDEHHVNLLALDHHRNMAK